MPFKKNEIQSENVRVWAAVGVKRETMASMLGMTTSMLTRHFQEELTAGYDHIHATLAGELYKRAMTDEKPAALFFMLKTKFRYRETDRMEHALEVPETKLEGIDYDSMTQEDRSSLRGILERNLKTAEKAQEEADEDGASTRTGPPPNARKARGKAAPARH